MFDPIWPAVQNAWRGKSPCPRRVAMGHVFVGHRCNRVAMDILDMSVTTEKGNRYLLVIVDCFSRCLFSVNRYDAGPVRLASTAHAFNYRIAVLRKWG